MKKIKVMTVFGTRPEAIKMAPLVKVLDSQKWCEPKVVVTGQHREMLDQVLQVFDIIPDYDLNIMSQGQTITDITVKVLTGFKKVLEDESPDIVLVHGDTTTTFAAGLASFYAQIPVGHVEAGLRTWNKYSPFPEEMNRQLTDDFTDLFFAPTPDSKENLLKENKPENQIYITGNTAIDAMKYTIKQEYSNELIDISNKEKRRILVTMHRRENLGDPMAQVFRAIKRITAEHQNTEVIFPMHRNPAVRDLAISILGDNPQVRLVEPFDVVDFQNILARCELVLTDSGGIQEEAPSLAVPVLVLRDTTERPEGVKAGTVSLIGTGEDDVYNKVNELLTNKEAYNKMAHAENPYGDGEASQRIADAIAFYFGIYTEKPLEFGK